MAEPAQVRQRGGEDVGVDGGLGQHANLPAPPCPAVRPGRSRLMGCIAVVGVVALIGCGGGDGTTTPATTALTPEQVAIGLDHPLCSEIESIEDLPEDGNCRERPTCQEVDDGAELPADGVCLDVTEP